MNHFNPYLPRKKPGIQTLSGQYVVLEPLDWERHGEGLAEAVVGSDNAGLWEFIPLGPFETLDAFRSVFSYVAEQRDWAPYVICDASDHRPLGTASYMRQRPEHGSSEVGCVVYGKSLQRTRGATEAMYLMARHIFEDLEYRRFEWKCHNGNAASKRAAERFGFTFEGVFRQDMVMKGKNRDTAWFSMINTEWPAIKTRYESWLSPENFDAAGGQIKSLIGT